MTAIHDAGIMVRPDDYQMRFRAWYRPMMRRLGKNSRLIVTVSKFSQGELHRYFGIPLDKIRVVSLSGEHMLETQPDDGLLDKLNLRGRRFLLAVNAMNARKNLGAVIEAVKLLGGIDFEVIVTGSNNDRVFRPVQWDLPRSFRHVGHVTNGELRSLYSHAMALIYPSLYEGFGLPPREAMTCGCPVLVSDIPAHRETCGDAAAYCDSNDPSDIADKIKEIMENDGLRSDLISRGSNRARQFSWKKTVTALIDRLGSSPMP
jgi:glycosyltransferase involved in cell wall biosynthesis